MNPVLEGKQKIEELFDKIELILEENVKVVNKLMTPITRKENID